MKNQIVPTVFALAILSLHTGKAQESVTKAFSSPEAACETLFQAVQNQDQPALEGVIGKELVLSGDESEAKLARQRFTEKYKEMHRLVQEPDGRTVLYVGAENWPFPVPLISNNGTWRFDSESGLREILLRSIGENETTAFNVAQLAIGTKGSAVKEPIVDDVSRFAASIRSALDDSSSQQKSFQGYSFVTRHGKGKKSQKIVLIAFPAQYRSSGVVTFIVAADGSVYEADLGPDTAKVAPKIAKRPHSGWYLAY